MQYRSYGHSEIKVSPLGFGAAQIGAADLSDAEALQILERVVAAGLNLLDTARAYGASEARIGQFLSRHRREDLVISTKVGYGIDGIPDWGYDSVHRGIEEALKKLKTDYLDIVHLHSCALETLQQGEVIAALQDVRQAGKIRVAAYSGENEALNWALHCGHFQGLQCSVNLCDQFSLSQILPTAQAKGLGVIAKRPLANAFWRFETQPHGDYAETYWQRWQSLNRSPGWTGAPELQAWPMDELALRFSVYAPGVSAAIAGSRNLKHLDHNLTTVAKGPFPADAVQALRTRFVEVGADWRGEV